MDLQRLDELVLDGAHFAGVECVQVGPGFGRFFGRAFHLLGMLMVLGRARRCQMQQRDGFKADVGLERELECGEGVQECTELAHKRAGLLAHVLHGDVLAHDRTQPTLQQLQGRLGAGQAVRGVRRVGRLRPGPGCSRCSLRLLQHVEAGAEQHQLGPALREQVRMHFNGQRVVEGQHLGPLHQLLNNLVPNPGQAIGGRGRLFGRRRSLLLLRRPDPQTPEVDQLLQAVDLDKLLQKGEVNMFV